METMLNSTKKLRILLDRIIKGLHHRIAKIRILEFDESVQLNLTV